MNPKGTSIEDKPKRRRRSPESARREILDAAGRQLTKEGPDGLRLQAIAADLGISHSSILHHFGSRDGLLDQLSIDAFQNLERDLKQSFELPPAGDPATALFDQIAQVLGARGHARLLAWQLLSGRGPTEPDSGAGLGETDEHEATGFLDRLSHTVQALRAEQARDQGRPAPELDETRKLLVWTACTVFGEALAGDLIMHSAGLGRDADARKRFRDWLAKAMEAQVFPPDEPGTETR